MINEEETKRAKEWLGSSEMTTIRGVTAAIVSPGNHLEMFIKMHNGAVARLCAADIDRLQRHIVEAKALAKAHFEKRN